MLACLLKLTLPYMPAGFSARPDVRDSMLVTRFEFATGIVAPPPSLGPTFLKMDIAHALRPTMLPFVFVFLFMLTFDAIGTLIGVCEQAGLMRENKLPRANKPWCPMRLAQWLPLLLAPALLQVLSRAPLEQKREAAQA